MMLLATKRILQAGVKPLAWIPNKPGFKFIGITKDAEEIECVVKLVDGMHCAYTLDDKPIFKELRYWREI